MPIVTTTIQSRQVEMIQVLWKTHMVIWAQQIWKRKIHSISTLIPAVDENPPQTTNENGSSTGSGVMNIEPGKNSEPTITQTQTNDSYNPPEPKIDLDASITINKPPLYESVKPKEEVKPKSEPVVKPVNTPLSAFVQTKPKETVEKPQEKPKPKSARHRNIWERPAAEDEDDDEIFKIKIPKKEATPSTMQGSQKSIKDAALKKIEPEPAQIEMEIELSSKSLKPTILNNKSKVAEGDLSSKLLEQPKMEKKPSKAVVFEGFPDKSSANKTQEKSADSPVQRSTSEKSTFNPTNLKQKLEIEKSSMKFKIGSDKTSGAAVTKNTSEPPVETAPLNDEDAIDHDKVLSELLEDIQSSHNDLYEECSQENSNQSTFVKPKGDDGEESNRAPKGSSTKKINLITKSVEKEREKEKEKKPEEVKPKISVHKPKSRIEEEEEEYYDDEEEEEEEEKYSESIPRKDRGEEERSRIRFDLQAMKKDFETLKRTKPPKYIKEF